MLRFKSLPPSPFLGQGPGEGRGQRNSMIWRNSARLLKFTSHARIDLQLQLRYSLRALPSCARRARMGVTDCAKEWTIQVARRNGRRELRKNGQNKPRALVRGARRARKGVTGCAQELASRCARRNWLRAASKNVRYRLRAGMGCVRSEIMRDTGCAQSVALILARRAPLTNARGLFGAGRLGPGSCYVGLHGD